MRFEATRKRAKKRADGHVRAADCLFAHWKERGVCPCDFLRFHRVLPLIYIRWSILSLAVDVAETKQIWG